MGSELSVTLLPSSIRERARYPIQGSRQCPKAALADDTLLARILDGSLSALRAYQDTRISPLVAIVAMRLLCKTIRAGIGRERRKNGRQDRRGRHGRAAKRLSAHEFA